MGISRADIVGIFVSTISETTTWPREFSIVIDASPTSKSSTSTIPEVSYKYAFKYGTVIDLSLPLLLPIGGLVMVRSI